MSVSCFKNINLWFSVIPKKILVPWLLVLSGGVKALSVIFSIFGAVSILVALLIGALLTLTLSAFFFAFFPDFPEGRRG